MVHRMYVQQPVNLRIGPADRPEAQAQFDPRFETFGVLVVE